MSLPPVDCPFTSSYTNEQPLLPTVRTNAVTQVPPAKKITFYKSGDPQFAGIKMAINQRSFKSFNALMDDLSHKIPLPFGVRAITTPRGIHFISTLDQLEDGGCYLCSDKKYVTPLNAGVANRKLGPQKVKQTASVLKRVVQDIKQEDYSMAFTQQSPRIPKKITLIKNGDITTQLPIILNRRNAQSFKVLLDEISEIMQFTVRKLYTIDGKRIDSMQGLLLCPNVLICVGQEPFKPILMQNPKKHSVEKLPGLASHSNSNTLGKKNEMNFGLKAKKSVIHPRSSLSNRSTRFSLSSEKSYMNGPATSPENGISSSNNCPKGEGLAPSLVNDDIEKKVYMNKDGSLSVEMKVCFHLLSDETLQWSTQIKKSSLTNQTLCEESDVMEDNQSEPIEKINQETSFEMEDSLYPCDADSYISNLDESENEVSYCHCCSMSHSNYDIWKNPMHASQNEEPGATNTWYTHSSCSSSSSHQRIVHKKGASIESIHTSSNERKHSEHLIQETSDFSDTLGNKRENNRIKKCCCQDHYMQTSKSQKELSEKTDDVASLASSENEHGSIVKKERNESRRSRTRSSKSKCRYAIESQINVLEERSSVVRTISSCSIKEREKVIGCSSSPRSACSKSSKCSSFGTKDKVEKISDNDHIPSYNKISSFSSDDCPPKINPQIEVEKEDEDNEINSVSEKMVSNSLIKDEVNRYNKRSKTKVSQSKVCNEEDRNDSSEMDIHSATVSASRIFNRRKCNQYDSKGDSKVSSGSSRGSTIKRKKTRGPLHVEDGRSSSGTTCSSENSHEVGKREEGGQLSHDSSHSNVSSLSEAAATSEENSSRISKCYSKSSRSSPKRTQREDTEVSSPISNVLESDGKNGADPAKNSTQENISRQGSSSESMCSKCGHLAETRNNDLQCVSSNNLLHSDAKSTCLEMQASENNEVSSQSSTSIAQSSNPRQKKRSNASVKYCSQGSEKASTTQFSFHSPVPPKGRPSSKNSRSFLKNIKSAPASNESEPTADELQKEMAGSQLPEMDRANEAEEGEGSGHDKKQIEEETVVQSETCDQIIPSSLPNASAEEVVHEWLRKIPSESLLMKSEMEKDEETIELHAEIPNCSNNQDSLEKECSEKEGAEDCEHLAEKDCPQDEKASEMISEEAETNQGECQHSDIPSQNNHKKDLPNTIQISVQIMKALLASKHKTKLGRSYSLPEVSPTLGKNLSNSANILIQCLATIQLLDEELDPSNKQNKCLNWFRYKELLNIFQAVWFGNILENGDPNLGLEGKGQIKTSSSSKDPNSKDGDFTTITSSGIDLSSGDGGSGEECGVVAHDCALLKEKRDKAKFPKEGKPEQEDGNEEEPKQHSQPLCSKLESENRAELAEVQEVIEAKEDQDHENSIELDANRTHDDQNVDDAENDSNEENILMEAQTDTMAKEVEKNPSEEAGNNETEPDSSVNEVIDEKEAKINSENQSVTKDDTESSNVSHQSTVKVSQMIQQRSGSQDPVWVLKLLKKIEKEFMTHYVSAMNEFKVKWNLTNNEELDLIIAELKEEVSRRIQKSVEKELNKIKSRTGKKIPKPPENELRQASTPELESRRRRLTSMLSRNYINDQSTNSNKQLESGDIDEDVFFYNTIQTDETYDDQLKDEEYCPCDDCMRKKMVSKTAQHTTEVMAKAPNPVLKAFDLQEILRMKNTSFAHRKTEYDISEAEQEEEEAEQEVKKTVESDGEEEAKCEEEQEVEQEEQEQEQEEKQEKGQEKEEEEKEERQEEEQEEEQEEKQEEGQKEEEEEKEEGQEEEQEEEQEEKQEEGKKEEEEQKEDQEEGQEEGQEEQEEEKEEGQEEEQEEKQEEGQKEEEEEKEERQEEEQEEEQEEKQEEGQKEEEEQKEDQEEEQEEGQEEQEEEKEEGQEEEQEEKQDEGQEEEEQKENQEDQEEEQEEGQEEQEEEEEGQEQEQEEKQEEGQEEKEEQEEGQEEQVEEQEEGQENQEGEKEEEQEEEEEQKEGQEEQEQEEQEKEEEKQEGEQEEQGQEQEEEKEEQEQEEEKEEQEEEKEEQEQEEEKEEQEEEKEEQEQEKEEEQEEGQEQVEGQEEEQEQEEQLEVEQQESVKGEGEENVEEEKPNIEDEEKSETESVKEKEGEEEKKTEEDIILGEPKEGKEDEEQEKDLKVELGEKEVIYEENNQEMDAKSEGDKELNDEEEMDGEQKETPKDDQEAEDEPDVTDNSAVEMDEKESEGDEPAKNVGESQAIIEEEIPDSSEQKSENNASLEAKSEACSETAEVEEGNENKEGDEAGENEAEGEDSNDSVQNPEDDRGTKENGTTEASEKGAEGIFSQQSREGSGYTSDEDESKKKDNISNEDGDCGSDGESKSVIESKPAKMYPDSNEEEEEEDQSSEASFVMGEDPPNEDNEDSHQVSKKKKQNSNVIDQDDLDF